ncbi:hypothetical protein SAY86_005159 [Trapa natans]|uniref:DUF3741 domain-containing protein n=1 Tax=Trapa natans TaxID=22666 RepID=A0AAN7L0A7_TRANT|nr:hypothetical protein SAY86_005159 [Trapa natans]
MKRQNSTTSTQLSSSSYRESIRPASGTSHLEAKSIGCMSGIVHLVCKYQNRHRFLITFGKKPEKNIIVTSPPPKKRSSVKSPEKSTVQVQRHGRGSFVMGNPDEQQPRRLSCEAAPIVRSPTIPPEIRRSNSLNPHKESLRPAITAPPPSLVARLMGLSDEPLAIPSDSAAEKRQKLVVALERCDQDLKALKKIIDTIRCSNGKANDGTADQGQPSPVSVLDGLARSPSLPRSMNRQPKAADGAERLQYQTTTTCYAPAATSLAERIKISITESPPPSEARKSSVSPALSLEDHRNLRHHTDVIDKACQDSRMKMVMIKGMKESVEKVCREVERGERREVGRIGVDLQDHICRDLIQETVKELGLVCNSQNPGIISRCRRRLSF